MWGLVVSLVWECRTVNWTRLQGILNVEIILETGVRDAHIATQQCRPEYPSPHHRGPAISASRSENRHTRSKSMPRDTPQRSPSSPSLRHVDFGREHVLPQPLFLFA